MRLNAPVASYCLLASGVLQAAMALQRVEASMVYLNEHHAGGLEDVKRSIEALAGTL